MSRDSTKRALSYYATAEDGMAEFDTLFSDNAADTLSCLVWCAKLPNQASFSSTAAYATATEKWKSAQLEMKTEVGKSYAASINEWINALPKRTDSASTAEYLAAVKA